MEKKKNKAKNLRRDSRKRHFLIGIILFMLIILGVFVFSLHGKQHTTPLTTTITPSAQNEDIHNLISYTIPSGWKEIKSNQNNYISLVSPDYKPPHLSQHALGGAELTLFSTKNESSSENVYDIITSIKWPGTNEGIKNYPHIAGKPAVTFFSCWEGCGDNYFFQNGNTLWRIIFTCVEENCNSTKEDLEKTPYTKARDEFINSLQLKK